MRCLLPALLMVVPAAAQFPAAAAPFVPPVHHGVIAIDFERLREADGGRVLATRICLLMLPYFVQVLKLDDVEQYLQFLVPNGTAGDGHGDREKLIQALVLCGERVALPARPGLEPVDVEGRKFVSGIDPYHWREEPGPSACVAAPGVVLVGPEPMLLTRFAPKFTPGVPGGDLLSMTLGRDVVAYWFVEVRPDTIEGLPEVLRQWLGVEPKVTHLALRLRVGGAELDEFTLEAVVRFRDRQLAADAAQALRNDFDAAARSRRLQSLRWLLAKLELQTSGTDVVVRLPRERYSTVDAVCAQLQLLSLAPVPPVATPAAGQAK